MKVEGLLQNATLGQRSSTNRSSRLDHMKALKNLDAMDFQFSDMSQSENIKNQLL